jgi:hypothetical protein
MGGGGGPFPECTIIFSKFFAVSIFWGGGGWKNHDLYQETFQIIFLLFFKFGGHPYTVPLIGPVNL